MEHDNIYNEVQKDRFLSSAAFDDDDVDDKRETEFPEQLIININSPTEPTMAEIIQSLRKHIITCNSSGIVPEIILIFCITEDGINEGFDMHYVTLAEYIDDISGTTEIKLSMMVRGIFNKYMYPLVFVDANSDESIIVKISKYAKIEELDISTAIIGDKYAEYIRDKCNTFDIKFEKILNHKYLITNKLIVQ